MKVRTDSGRGSRHLTRPSINVLGRSLSVVECSSAERMRDGS